MLSQPLLLALLRIVSKLVQGRESVHLSNFANSISSSKKSHMAEQTHHRLTFKKGLWWKGALVSLSGLMVDIVMLIPLSLFALVSAAFNNRIFSMMAVAPLISQIVQILYNLPPRNIKRDGRKGPNDTKLLWYYLTGKYGKALNKSLEEFKSIVVRYDQNYHTATPWFVNADSDLFSQYLEATKNLFEK